MSKKIAVFDIDGTLFRWQLFHELVFELSEMGAFSAETKARLNNAFAAWRGQQTTWHEYEHIVVHTIRQNITKISSKQLEQAAQNVIDKSGDNVHAYTASLAKSLKSQGYYLLAISGSHQEIAQIFAEKHGFDHCIGVVYGKATDGKYSQEIARDVVGKKGGILQEFIKNNGFTNDNSYAIGDSASDIDMLKLVENPIAFNPDEKLLNEATNNGWKVVVERKNIAYTLTKQGTKYELAKADTF